MAQKKTKKTKTSKTSRAKAARKPAVRRSAARPKRAGQAAKGMSLGSIPPSLTVNDLTASMAWYCDILGFSVGQRWENNGVLRGAELKAGKTLVYLSQEDGAQGDRVKGQGFRLYW